MIRTDLSGFAVAVYSGLCDQIVYSRGLGIGLPVRTGPPALWQKTPESIGLSALKT